MTKVFFLILILNFSAHKAKADEKMICAGHFALKYKPLVLSFKNDKAKHCALSCLISKRCFIGETFTLGLIKEVADVLGYGTPELADLRANILGIKLAYTRPEADCLKLCQEIFF